ncbi:minichromosome maintenance protein 5 [Entophlyctis luteolus]|nr:minichromosome maintenance protein 5 [Entophlyctis luteolus]
MSAVAFGAKRPLRDGEDDASAADAFSNPSQSSLCTIKRYAAVGTSGERAVVVVATDTSAQDIAKRAVADYFEQEGLESMVAHIGPLLDPVFDKIDGLPLSSYKVYLQWIVQTAFLPENRDAERRVNRALENVAARCSIRIDVILESVESTFKHLFTFVEIVAENARIQLPATLLDEAKNLRDRRLGMVHVFKTLQTMLNVLLLPDCGDFEHEFIRYVWTLFLLYRGSAECSIADDITNMSFCAIFSSCQVPSCFRRKLFEVFRKCNFHPPRNENVDIDWLKSYQDTCMALADAIYKSESQTYFGRISKNQQIIDFVYARKLLERGSEPKENERDDCSIPGVPFACYTNALDYGPDGRMLKNLERTSSAYEKLLESESLKFDYRLFLPAYRMIATPRKKVATHRFEIKENSQLKKNLATIFAKKQSVFANPMAATPFTAINPDDDTKKILNLEYPVGDAKLREFLETNLRPKVEAVDREIQASFGGVLQMHWIHATERVNAFVPNISLEGILKLIDVRYIDLSIVVDFLKDPECKVRCPLIDFDTDEDQLAPSVTKRLSEIRERISESALWCDEATFDLLNDAANKTSANFTETIRMYSRYKDQNNTKWSTVAQKSPASSQIRIDPAMDVFKGLQEVFTFSFTMLQCRLNDMCKKMNLSSEILEKANSIILDILNKKCMTNLLRNRHLDIIMLCSLFAACRLNNVLVNFAQLREIYDTQPQAIPETTLYIVDEDGKEKIDIAVFYNRIFRPYLDEVLSNREPSVLELFSPLTTRPAFPLARTPGSLNRGMVNAGADAEHAAAPGTFEQMTAMRAGVFVHGCDVGVQGIIKYMDSAATFAVPVLGPSSTAPTNGISEERAAIIARFLRFVAEFRIDNAFIIRDQLKENVFIRQYFIEVDLAHLAAFDEDLASNLRENPAVYMPLFEDAVKSFARESNLFDDVDEMPDFQVLLLSNMNPIPIREIDSSHVSKLVKIHGITIAAANPSVKATHIQIMCKACRHTKNVPISGGFSGIQLPRKCDGEPVDGQPKECPLDPYLVIHEKSRFIDMQTLKLQEAADVVPTGELPRHVLLSCDRYLTNKVIPGGSDVAIRSPYLRVIGMQSDADGGKSRVFTAAEEQEFLAISRRPNLYEEFASSIAPQIFGNEDIKKAIACLLMGGSKKVLPDSVKLRGDVNVLLLGDPGTAKSQLLKFVEKVAPTAVYTSGKGSSAAGLTASVVRDPATREFHLEAGAMVLADSGVVCIDEFDKMREEDRVAIHEAMEQQTISIAKAGITTILNSRTSVLAAANPVFGRYDDMKSAGENIDFQSTILSRFDLIFIVKDEHDDIRDKTLAKHVLGVHQNDSVVDTVGGISMATMRSYISYCKSKCAPRLSVDAAQLLSSHFVEVRSKVRSMDKRSAIPITVRQLEAIIRISESIAKLSLSPVATERHVQEAIRLFNYSTMNAVQAGNSDGLSQTEVAHTMAKVHAYIRRRLQVGGHMSYAGLVDSLITENFPRAIIERSILVLLQKEVLVFEKRRLSVKRIAL